MEGLRWLLSSIAGVPCLCSQRLTKSWLGRRQPTGNGIRSLSNWAAISARFGHEHLTPIRKRELELIGWTKARELAKVARRDRQGFDCAPWVHKASTMPREEFKREVDRYLTGKDTEPWEILYFKAYKSQLPVIEQALETAARMLGSDKSRGYCLEMICADFLAGVSLETGNQDALLPCLTRLVIGLSIPQRKQLLEDVQVTL